MTLDKRYLEAIQQALIKEWDPIGVGEFPEAQNEYDSYVLDIYRLIVARRSKEEIFNYLWELETGHMGLKGDRPATEHFAERLARMPQEIEGGV
jgi:hypothetical protein